MKATIKLNPVRLSVPKYGNGLMLMMETLSQRSVMPTKIIQLDDSFEFVLPLTKHSIRPLVNYINANL